MKEESGISVISILGSGWLGSPLARNLLAERYQVKGSTTHPEKKSIMKDVGIKPYLLTLEPEITQLRPDDFFTTDLLIIAVPPKIRNEGEAFHPEQIKAVIEEIKRNKIKYCIYISSTSVYPNLEREVTEEDAPEPADCRHTAVCMAEKLLKETEGLNLTILRCGGLMGYDRIPGKYFAGKKDLDTGDIPVNYVHRDDVIGVVLEVLRQNYWNKIVNVVAPEHPSRKEVYLRNAADFGMEPPTFTTSRFKDYKIVNADKLQRELNYRFRYPDPLEFRYS